MPDRPSKPKRRAVDRLFGGNDEPSPPPPELRKRPFDALLGDTSATPTPTTYVVEMPKPVTTVSPPPPELPPHAAPPPAPTPQPPPADYAAPAPASIVPPSVPESMLAASNAIPDVPAFALEPAVEPQEPETFGRLDYAPSPYVDTGESTYPAAPAYPSDVPYYATNPAAAEPTPEPPPDATAPATPAPQGEPTPEQSYFAQLPEMIERLYDQVGSQILESPVVAEYCMKLLLQAREAYLRGDYAAAEFYVESVDAKLKRSAKSMKHSHGPVMLLLWVWQLLLLSASGAVIAMSYIDDLTLFGLPVAPEFIVLMRAVGWGGVGGVVGAIYNMFWFVQYREYDPAYSMNYFARPLQGLILGGIIFLISQAGIFAGSIVVPGASGANGTGELAIGPVFLYALAALAGFKQEYVYEFLDNIMKTIFRIPRPPDELAAPAPMPDNSLMKSVR